MLLIYCSARIQLGREFKEMIWPILNKFNLAQVLPRHLACNVAAMVMQKR